MIEKIKYFPVNWVDGMKINKNHFIAMQNYTQDVNRDSIGIFLNKSNYGLLSNIDGSSADISVKVDAHDLLRITINECYAITPNGSRVEITPQEPFQQEESYSMQADGSLEGLLIKLSVNPFEKNEFGERDPQESPPRLPFLKSKYNIDITSSTENSIDSGYQITIGKVILKNGNLFLDENFIPPSMTTESHPRLVAAHNIIDTKFGELELYSVQIAQKINRKQQSNQLAQMVLGMTEKILTYLGMNMNSLRWSGLVNAPSYMLDKPVSLARVIKNYVDSKSGAGKEELLNYFAEWCDLSQSQFETLFLETINVGYNHVDISQTVITVEKFLDIMVQLLSQINNLDYIGQRGDAGIFVKEQPIDSNITRSKRNRSFLDD